MRATITSELFRKVATVVASFAALAACSPPTAVVLAPSIRVDFAGPSSARSVVVIGSAASGSSIELYADERCATAAIQTVSAMELATGVRLEAAANATTHFSARASLDGVFSSCSAPASFVHDDVAPGVPSLTSVTGLGGLPPRVRVSGTAERGARVRVFLDDTCTQLGTEIRADDAQFEVELTAVANAQTRFSARAVDAANNASGCSNALSFAHDQLAPPAPQFDGVTPASPSRVSTPTVTGTAEALATVRFFFDVACAGAPAATTSADASGRFSAQLPVQLNSLNRVYAVAVDASANVSACGGPLQYEHDDLPPTVFFNGTSPATPSRTATAFTVNVSASESASIELFTTADCTGAPATGVIMVTPNVALTVSARATDVVGNTSSCAVGPTLLNDTLAPGVPVITSSAPASPSRTSQSPVLLGTADPSGTLRLYRAADCTGSSTTYTVSAAGQFSASTSVTANTSTAFSATVTDQVGNVSGCSAPFTFTHDNRVPLAPILWSTLPPSPIKTTGPVKVVGLAEAGSLVTLTTTGTCVGGALPTVTAGPAINSAGQGLFTVSLNPTLGTTTTTVSALASDAAGNRSSCSAPLTYIESTTLGWRDDVELGFSSGRHNFPEVALTASGTAVAIFGRSNATPMGVFRSERVNGTWSAPTILTDPNDPLAMMTSPPRVVSDASGTVLAGWTAYDLAALARRGSDGSWTTQALGVSSYGRAPDVALDGSGNGVVASERFVTNTVRIFVRRSTGATWGAEAIVSDVAYSSFEPRVAMASSGRALISFARNTGSGANPRDELWSTTGEASAAFPTATQRSATTALFDRRDVRVGMSSAGEAIAVWLQSSQILGPWTVTSAATTGGIWASGTSITTTTTSQRELDTQVLASGEAMALWRLNGSSLQYARRPAGGTWSAGITLPGATFPVAPRLAADSSGRFVAVWKTLDALGGSGELWFSTFSLSGWSAPQLLDLGVGLNDTCSLALDASGRAVAVWTKAQGADTVVRTRALE